MPASGGVEVLAIPALHTRAEVLATNYDGSASAGFAQRGDDNTDSTAVRWTADGQVHEIPFPVVSPYSQATAISGDGNTIVGTADQWDSTLAFMWTPQGGTVFLETPIGGHSQAMGLSPDGQFVTGQVWPPGNGRMALWGEEGLRDLGVPLGSGMFAATGLDVSANGLVVVGRGSSSILPEQACIWTPITGNILFADYLAQQGIAVPDHITSFASCTSVSADGLIIAGGARTSTGVVGFVAYIKPTECQADFNSDGGVDGADVEAFFLAWERSDPSADVNTDGGVDGADVQAFFVPWEAGGC
jgi:uncharacterized membrane protein